MVALSAEAEAHIRALTAHDEASHRIKAAENLLSAIERARDRIEAAPESGLDAPRPYPALRREGRRWILEGSYWISYVLTSPPVISGVFYVTANIPRRIS